MKTNVTPQELIGRKVVDSEGSKIGTIGQVYLDDRTGEPEWVTVKTGMFGGRESFVPLGPADMQGDDLRVPFDKELVKEAPSLGTDEHLSPEEEARLYRHYSVTPSGGMTRTGTTEGTAGTAAAGAAGTAAAAGSRQRSDMSKSQLAGSDDGYEELTGKHDPSVRTNDPPARAAGALDTTAAGTAGAVSGRTARPTARTDAGAAGAATRPASAASGAARTEATSGKAGMEWMTRSEERLDVHVETIEAGRAALRKVVETERVDKVVPVMHEEWEIVREPIDDSNRGAALKGPDMRESALEIVLHAERVVVHKEVVPVERIRLVSKRVQGEQRVTEEVRRERIELHDGDKVQVLDGKGERLDKNR
ncbi:DUF2382 domain-containing protein [Embleya sp. MST-111070]|uniref:DUF2382 domain-containing protein n=1 Tax=Embleya sp. MST-111070 TaxID=3398231 RepID=UPI003F732C3C